MGFESDLLGAQARRSSEPDVKAECDRPGKINAFPKPFLGSNFLQWSLQLCPVTVPIFPCHAVDSVVQSRTFNLLCFPLLVHW